jgi:hypothetical protein
MVFECKRVFKEKNSIVDKGASHERKKEVESKIIFNNGSKFCVGPLHWDLKSFLASDINLVEKYKTIGVIVNH